MASENAAQSLLELHSYFDIKVAINLKEGTKCVYCSKSECRRNTGKTKNQPFTLIDIAVFLQCSFMSN